LTSSTTFLLVALLLLLIATRPFEERRWRAGQITDEVAAWLIVGRLPALALGFSVIAGLVPIAVLGLTVIALAVAFLLEPVALRRILAVKARERS
jgi:hypothetical protein